MTVEDSGDVISIDFRTTEERESRPWKRSTFPTPLITVDHSSESELRIDGPGGDVIGIELIGSAAQELRDALCVRTPDTDRWEITYGDETRFADSYDHMREIAAEISRQAWIRAGEPLDPRWPRAAAEEHVWRQVRDRVREIPLPDDTVIRVEAVKP